MSQDFSVILQHPDCEEILSKIFTGTSPKQINQWLKQKYPTKEQKHLHITIKMLTVFVNSEYTNYYDQVAKDVSAVKHGGSIDKNIADSLVNNKTYQARINEIAESNLDLKKMMIETITIIRARAEQVFDKIQNHTGNIGKGDYALIKWFELLFNAFEKYDKHVNNAPDQIIHHNITIQAVEEHTALFQDVIRKTLAQIDPDASMLFMEIFTDELRKMKPPKKDTESTFNDTLADVKLLQETVIDD